MMVLPQKGASGPVPLSEFPMTDTLPAIADAPCNAATLVPDARRGAFLPALFGRRHFFKGETLVYSFLQWLSADYGGGYWQFMERAGHPLYLVPAGRPAYRICCNSNGYEGTVSADAAGIIAALFAFSHLSFEVEDDHLAEAYHRLRDYAGDHPEAAKIFGAID